MKKVLIVIARFEFGGIPTQSFLWARYLKQHSYEPVILAPRVNDIRYCRMLEGQGIAYDTLKVKGKSGRLFGNVSYLLSLIRSVNSYKPFAILPFNKLLGYNINLVWRLTNAKKCFFLERNDGRDSDSNWLGRLTKGLALKSSTALVFNSDAAARHSPYPHKTFVIKNSFVNPLRGQGESIADIGLPGDSVVLLHVANVVRQKNYGLLLDSWPKLRAKNPKLYLVIIGGTVKETLQTVLAKTKQEGIIHLGMQPDVFPYIRRADLCILSTFYEGCPNVVLEYMQLRKLICASDVPAIREVLSDANHELLFDNASEDDLITKVEHALHMQQGIRDKIIQDNYSKLLTDYSENNYGKIVDLLNC